MSEQILPESTGAPATSDYLVGTSDSGLSAEIVVGTSPGGELGGTWASPTVDATHSGSAHVALTSNTPAAVSTTGAVGSGTASAKDDHVHAHETAHLAHDTLWDAKGDLVAATGADTASKLSLGTNGYVLTADSSVSNGVKWAAISGGGGSGGLVTPFYVEPLGGNTGNAFSTVGASNNAIFRPCVIPVDCSVVGIRVNIGTSSGNIDAALYDESFNRVAAVGGVASPGTGLRTLTFASSPVSVTAGRYWVAVAANNNTVTFLNALAPSTGLPGGSRSQGTAYTLPNPAAPGAGEVTGVNLPVMVLMINGGWP